MNRDHVFANYLLRLEHSVELIVAGGSRACLPPQPRMAPEKLTAQEARVLQVLAEGYSNQEIAAKLFVSDSTVRTHLRNINSKLDAKSRTQAIAVGRHLGMI